MRPHPYLRAYMAGIVVPTLFLLVILCVFTTFRLSFPVGSLANAIVFPMAERTSVWCGNSELPLRDL